MPASRIRQQPGPNPQQKQQQQHATGAAPAAQSNLIAAAASAAGPAQGFPKYSTVEDFHSRVEIYRGRHSVVWNVVCKVTKKPLILKGYVKVCCGGESKHAAPTGCPPLSSLTHATLPPFSTPRLQAKMTERNFHQVKREIRLMQQIRYEGTVRIHGNFEDGTTIYIVQEICAKVGWGSGLGSSAVSLFACCCVVSHAATQAAASTCRATPLSHVALQFPFPPRPPGRPLQEADPVRRRHGREVRRVAGDPAAADDAAAHPQPQDLPPGHQVRPGPGLSRTGTSFLAHMQCTETQLPQLDPVFSSSSTANLPPRPENIFFMRDGHMKLGDFGLAIDASLERPKSRVGTLGERARTLAGCCDAC
jgi:hypothetical protein